MENTANNQEKNTIQAKVVNNLAKNEYENKNFQHINMNKTVKFGVCKK